MATWIRVDDCVINLAMVEQITHSKALATEDDAYWILQSPRCDTLVTKENDPGAYAAIRGFLCENAMPVGPRRAVPGHWRAPSLMRLKYPLSKHPAYIPIEDGLAEREYRERQEGYYLRRMEQYRFNDRVKAIVIGVPLAIVSILTIAVLLWALFTGRLA